MPSIAVIGIQWGDEGKAKIIDCLASRVDIVARFQGGDNAGHTIKFGEENFIFHLIPSGAFYPSVKCVIGNGLVINPARLFEEIENLKSRSVSLDNRLFISDRAHIILPHHILFEMVMEAHLGKKKIGTTLRGIGPAYRSKYSRIGIRTHDLLEKNLLWEKIMILDEDSAHIMPLFDPSAIPDLPIKKYFDVSSRKLDTHSIYEDYLEYGERIKPFLTDTSDYLTRALKNGQRILFEGAQGTMLDIDHGTYPYVTSSNSSALGIAAGLGISPKTINHILGVMKAYTTRVGEGPFPTKETGHISDHIREMGWEYGSTTGRPRHCGWLDFVALRYSARINGIDSLAVTKLDVLDQLDEIKICLAYKKNGRIIEHFPADIANHPDDYQPIYEKLPGWKTSTKDIDKLEDLPTNARKYLDKISEILQLPISLVSVGADRKKIIFCQDLPI